MSRPSAVDPSQASLFDAGGASTVFRHPRAEREIRLEQHRVAYALKRGPRRSIGFVVGAEGLCVKAPKWVALRDIEAALHAKAGWILAKLQAQRERTQRLQAAQVDWRDGVAIPFLGQALVVVLDARGAAGAAGVRLGARVAARVPGARLDSNAAALSRAWLDGDAVERPGALLDSAASALPAALLAGDANARPGAPCLTLHLDLPPGAAPAQIRDAVQGWLQREARRVFEERCRHYAARLGVRYTRLSLSSARTRWGSASASGAIRLNWRLIHFTLSTIDYVVAHELAHLRHMDHSPRFWDVVRSVAPDYQRARTVLKTQTLPQFD